MTYDHWKTSELYDDRLASRWWVEEFAIDGKPGGHAINVVFVVEPKAMQ